NALRRLGFGDDDFAGGGSDRFIDANVAWGNESAIRKRIAEHWEAGADHVCIQSISPDGSRRPDDKVLALLAPAGRSQPSGRLDAPARATDIAGAGSRALDQ